MAFFGYYFGFLIISLTFNIYFGNVILYSFFKYTFKKSNIALTLFKIQDCSNSKVFKRILKELANTIFNLHRNCSIYIHKLRIINKNIRCWNFLKYNYINWMLISGYYIIKSRVNNIYFCWNNLSSLYNISF